MKDIPIAKRMKDIPPEEILKAIPAEERQKLKLLLLAQEQKDDDSPT